MLLGAYLQYIYIYIYIYGVRCWARLGSSPLALSLAHSFYWAQLQWAHWKFLVPCSAQQFAVTGDWRAPGGWEKISIHIIFWSIFPIIFKNGPKNDWEVDDTPQPPPANYKFGTSTRSFASERHTWRRKKKKIILMLIRPQSLALDRPHTW